MPEPTLRYPCCEHCDDWLSACPDHLDDPCCEPGCPGRIPFELETEG